MNSADKYSKETLDSYARLTVITSTGTFMIVGMLLVLVVTKPVPDISQHVIPWVIMGLLFLGAVVQMARSIPALRRYRRLAAADRVARSHLPE